MLEALLAKKWKNESANLKPGRRWIDEEIVVRVTGSVERRDDQLITPTVSIPMVTTLALLVEKMGVTREHALNLLRESLSEAMSKGIKEDASIKKRIDDVEAAITTVRQELIDQLPKMKRAGSLIVDDLQVEVEATPVTLGSLIGAA